MTSEPTSPSDAPTPTPPPAKWLIGDPASHHAEDELWHDLDTAELEDTDGPPPAGIPPQPIRQRAVQTEVVAGSPIQPGYVPATPIRLPTGKPSSSVLRSVSMMDLSRSGQTDRKPITPTPISPSAMEADFDDLEDWAIPERPLTPPEPTLEPTPKPSLRPAATAEDETKKNPAPRPDPSLLAHLPALADLSELPDFALPAAPDRRSPAEAPPATTDLPPTTDLETAADLAPPADSSTPAGPESADSPAPAPAEPPTPPKPAEAGDEFTFKPSATASPHLPKPRLKLALLEKIGLAVFLILLLAAGIWVYSNSLARMTGEKPQAGTALPARGEFVTITRIDSYWRAPITSGPDSERVKLEITLIPVVEMTVSGRGTIRALFSDDTGTNVGDPVDREVNGETTLTIPCTAGFKELADHRAYQVDLIKAWHIKLLEAPPDNTSGLAFKFVATAPIGPRLK